MRENEKKLNVQDDENNISTPVFWVTALVVILVGVMIWFGIKNPDIFSDLRNLLITLVSITLFILGAAAAVLCFFLASRLKDARKQVDEGLSTADGKVEEIAVLIEDLLRKILEPFISAKSKKTPPYKTAAFFVIGTILSECKVYYCIRTITFVYGLAYCPLTA